MDLQWTSEIKKNTPASIYLFYGSEAFLQEQSVAWMCDKLLTKDELSLNRIKVDLTEQPIQSVIEEAKQLSLGGGRKVIIGQNATFLTAEKTNRKQPEHAIEMFLDYMAAPVQRNVLILMVDAELDRRKKVVQAMLKHTKAVKMVPLTDQQLREWVIAQAKKQEAQIEPQAIAALINLVGNNLSVLYQEIVKLALFSGEDIITVEDVEKLVVRCPEHDIFRLINQIAAQDTKRALRTWADLVFIRTEPIAVFALIIRQFRLMLLCKLFVEQGWSAESIADRLRVHAYPVKLAIEAGKRFSIELLRSNLFSALELDAGIKMGKIDKLMAVESFIVTSALR